MKQNQFLTAFVCIFVFCFLVETGFAYLYGIDVSRWQGTIHWSSVKASGNDFAFIKATEGVQYVDPQFSTNISGAHASGLYAGCYHFATPFTGGVMDAGAEAADFASAIGPYLTDGYLRPVLDLERGYEYGKASLSNWIHTFMSTMVSLTGIEPLIYCNSWYANEYFETSIAQYDLWIARWTYDPSTPPDSSTCGIWDDWNFWQYSDSGSVAGINGAVDLNVFQGNIMDFVIPEPATLLLLSLGAVFVRAQRQ